MDPWPSQFVALFLLSFFGDYTDMAAGSDSVLHAFWTDSNNEQSVTWFYGLEFTPTLIHQQDVVTGAGP